MKPETKRRVKNLIHLLSQGATVESCGDYIITTYRHSSREVTINGSINYLFRMIPHYKFGKVLMP